MAQYIGPTASVAHILRKPLVIFGTVASFNILMPNIYKVMQGNHELVPSFAMRLEGTLNQIRLQWEKYGSWGPADLKEHLFHEFWKHIWDSVQYLYSTLGTSYSQLMVTAHKAESKNNEIWDKVRARAAAATNSGEGMAELGQQIARLIVALTRAGQGSNPSSAPSSPQERGHGRGHSCSSTPNHLSSHNSINGPGQTTPACSLPSGCGKGAMELEAIARVTKGLAQGGRAQLIGVTHISLQCFRFQGWNHMPRECPTPASALN